MQYFAGNNLMNIRRFIREIARFPLKGTELCNTYIILATLRFQPVCAVQYLPSTGQKTFTFKQLVSSFL